MRSKTLELLTASSDTHHDLIALTETWLCDGIYNSEIFDPYLYNVFRTDRFVESGGLGGGVLLAVRNTIACVEITLPESLQKIRLIDIVGIKLLTGHKHLFVFCVYIPPKSTIKDYELFFDEFSNFCIQFSDVLVMGDFNLPGYNGNSSDARTRHLNLFNNFLSFTGFVQTNFISNINDRVLDIILNNSSSFSSLVGRGGPLLREDFHHPALSITLKYTDKQNIKKCLGGKKHFSYNFRKANYLLLYEEISKVDWTSLYKFDCVDNALEYFYSVIYKLFDMFIPKKPSFVCNKYPLWFDNSVIILIKKKQKSWIKFKNSKSQADLTTFKLIRSEAKSAIKRAYKNYLLKVENDFKSNPNTFWTYINNKNKNVSLPQVMTNGNLELNSPQDIVNSFATYFESVFSSRQTRSDVFPEPSNYNYNLINVHEFNVEEVQLAIGSLTSKFTAGPDEIPSFFVKDCATVLAQPLCTIFNLIIQTGYFPQLWKTSKITPILKHGNKSEISNYRPIALISNFSKVFESVLHARISRPVSVLLSDNQHGFVQGRSTLTNLINTTQAISRVMDKTGQIDVIYIDLSKAFDTLDHRILLKKLSSFGLSQSLVQIFSSYLSNRFQYVQCRGHKSDPYSQKSGVPQGSVLGPLLFNIFINDIQRVIDIEFLLYADDIKLLRQINSIQDCRKLQENLNQTYQWFIDNNLQINFTKCKVMTYSRKKNILNFDYLINLYSINRPEFIQDLGVTFDKHLNFKQHVITVTNRASKVLGFIMRSSKEFSKTETNICLYKTLVRAKLEYASIVWNPATKTSINTIEKVQRRFLKGLAFRLDGVYPQRGFPQESLLNRFEIMSLETRRKIAGILFLNTLLNGAVNNPQLLTQITYRAQLIRSRNKDLFYVEKARTCSLENSPIRWMQQTYNTILKSLPDIDIYFDKKRAIKSKLLKHFKT